MYVYVTCVYTSMHTCRRGGKLKRYLSACVCALDMRISTSLVASRSQKRHRYVCVCVYYVCIYAYTLVLGRTNMQKKTYVYAYVYVRMHQPSLYVNFINTAADSKLKDT
jgi:hypothetical protein